MTEIRIFLLLILFAQYCFAEPVQWARFLGPNGQNVSDAKGLPVQWDTQTNIRWKCPIPGKGWSSPIVWGETVFLTTATDEGKNCHVIALDRRSGKILWDKLVFEQVVENKHAKNSYATPTPVTDGQAVYAVFCDGSFVALDFQGNILWTNREMNFYSQHGMGTSPVLYKELLLLSVNPSSREEPKQRGWLEPWEGSYLLALDKSTGRTRWTGKRGLSRIAHATPCIIQVQGKDQILSPAGDVIQGFDPNTGERLWTVRSVGEPCVPSPAIGDGLVYSAPAGSAVIRAVRTDGKGECTETHIQWEQKRNTPMMASLLYVEPVLYSATDSGSFTCYDAKTGEFLWQKRIGEPLNATPLYADGKLYLPSEAGTVTVLKPNEDPTQVPETLAQNEMEEPILASIAVAGTDLIIRSENHLWCIETEQPESNNASAKSEK